MPSAAAARSASANTMTGALPPSSRWTRLTLAAAAAATCEPARTDPVMATMSGRWCETSARPVSRSPQTTFSTPGGSTSVGDLPEQQRRGRRRVGRLEHDRVAGRERRGDLPDRHHQRVVPRRHLADDPDRLAPHPGGVARHVLPRAQPVEHAGGAGEEPQLVDAGRHLVGRGQVQRLAGVAGLDGDELVGTLLDRVGEAQQRELALGRRRAAPRGERLRRRAVGRVDVLRPGQRRAGVLLPGGRVDHRRGAAVRGGPLDAPDHVAQLDASRRSGSRVLSSQSVRRTLRRRTSAREPWTVHSADRTHRGRRNQKFTRPVTTDSLASRAARRAPPSAGGHTQTSAGAPGARRRLQGDRRAAPGGRPAAVRHHRQGDRAVRGRRAPARPAPHRLRRHADRRGDRPAPGGLLPAGDDRAEVRGRPRRWSRTRSPR